MSTSNNNVKSSKVKKSHRHKTKSYLGKILTQSDRPNIALFCLEVLLAVLLDLLNFMFTVIVIVLGVGIIGVIIGFLIILGMDKIGHTGPLYTLDTYKQTADDVVSSSNENTFKMSESSYIYDSDGNTLAKLRASEDSMYLSYDDIPSDVVNGFIAVEDRTFWDNPGYDVKGIVRVIVNYVKSSSDEVHGASTITQQLVRTNFLTREVSLERKIKEIFMSIDMTRKYTKKQIMEFYVNDCCFANAYYGIEAASEGYFGKKASELSLSQQAYLCAIPNSPTYYDPYKDSSRALKRRDKILSDMLECGYITEDDYNEAINEVITVSHPEQTYNNYQTTFAIDCAVKYLMKLDNFEFKYDFSDDADYNNYEKTYSDVYDTAKNELYNGGYKVYTTLNSNIQVKLQQALDDGLSFDETTDDTTGVYSLQGAITAIDNSTGKVIGIIGGRSQDTDSKTYTLNRAFQSERQSGSSIKPLIDYTPAMELCDMTPDSTVTDVDIDKAKKLEYGESVDSLGGSKMKMRSALEQSINGVAWWLMSKVGVKNGLQYIKNMEFSDIVPSDNNMAVSLGGFTYGVTTVEMAGAYSTLENHGSFREPTCLVKMLDKSGTDIFRDSSEVQIYQNKSSDDMIDMMKGVITKGTASKLNWSDSSDVEAAAKTGTTNDNKDGWLCGVTPYYTVTVWVGYDTPKEMNGLWGSTYPGKIWKQAMLDLLDYGNYTDGEFTRADYSDDSDTSDEKYLPGRSDDEVLDGDYTVGDYRADHKLGDTIEDEIVGLYYLDNTSSSFADELKSAKNKISTEIEGIKSTSYKEEVKADLIGAYKNALESNGLTYDPSEDSDTSQQSQASQGGKGSIVTPPAVGTVTNADGSSTNTIKYNDGSVMSATTYADGTQEIVYYKTNKDGTQTVTTQHKDGSTTSVTNTP